MSEKKEKSAFCIYAEYYPFLLLYKLLEKLPLKTGCKISMVLMKLLFVFDRRHASRTVSHLLHAGMCKTREEAVAMAKRSFDEFACLLVEIVKMPQLYSKSKIFVDAPEAAKDRLFPSRNPEGPRNVIVATAHLGNWEVAGTAFAEMSDTPMTSIMRPFGNPLIGKLILDHRAGTMHTLAEKSKGIRPLLKALNNNQHATILIDQHAAGSEGVVCEFFGHPARVHMTPALLHLKTGVPIVPELTVRRPGFNFEFDIVCGEPIVYTPTGDKQKDVQTVTQMTISGLEKLIRRYPDQWLWAPRHWLDIDRRQAEAYKNWKPEGTGMPEGQKKENE